MKGGFYGLKGKEFYLILIALVGMTIVLWTWEKTPLLSAFLPPQSRLLQLSTVSSISEPQIYVSKDISAFEEKETVNDQEEQHFDAVTPVGPAKSSPEMSKIDSYLNASPSERKEIPISVTEEEPKNKQIPEAESNGNAEIPTSTTEVEENHKQMLAEKNLKESVALVAPTGSVYTSSSVREKNNETLMENQACNYAKGKWVVDSSRPLYSGFGCKQWLAGMWACRLMKRTDFAYEKIRWQPKNCQMEEFEGSKFLRRMQDKTLAFVGDSLGRQQFQSLMCMITGGKDRRDVIDVGREYGLIRAHGAVRPNGWAFRFPSTNTTILYYWSASLCDLEPLDITKPTTEYAMHLDRPPAFLRQYLHKFDVLVLNTGHHWNRGKLNANRWVMYVGGVPNTDRKIAQIGGAKNLTIHSVVKWVNSQLPKYPGLKAFFRSISPRHFVNGDWNTGGSCDNTTPMSIGKEILQDESSDLSAASAVRGTKVKLLDITALSQLRDEGHISRFSLTASPGVQDCLHWCLPGVPDTWNEILFAQI